MDEARRYSRPSIINGTVHPGLMFYEPFGYVPHGTLEGWELEWWWLSRYWRYCFCFPLDQPLHSHSVRCGVLEEPCGALISDCTLDVEVVVRRSFLILSSLKYRTILTMRRYRR